MKNRPISIAVVALGGQGGGVLTGWIVDLAEASGWIAQSTSVPGVAQRTGTTIYYVEIARADGSEPVMALMPTPGDVDIVIAAELMEAGRAIARGLVTPDRTTLIASSHRIFSIGEKSALGDGRVSPAAVIEAAQQSARNLVLADLSALAERHKAPISAALFGALAGSGALPFAPDDFLGTIERFGMRGDANRQAFQKAFDTVRLPQALNSPAAQYERGQDAQSLSTAELPQVVRPIARIGVERLIDYQGDGYAALYLRRLAETCLADTALGGEKKDYALGRSAARHLALWMAYEDVFRVADLKTRATRIARIAAEAGGSDRDLLHVTEFMHPRFDELCDSLPAKIGAWLRDSPRGRKLLNPLFRRGRFIRTTSLGGFAMLWLIACLGRWRPHTLRWREEQERIDIWLASAVEFARRDYDLGVETIRLQRLVKGYGETQQRGLRNFDIILAAAGRLLGRREAAATIAQLHEAALADDEGIALAKLLATLPMAESHAGQFSTENISA